MVTILAAWKINEQRNSEGMSEETTACCHFESERN